MVSGLLMGESTSGDPIQFHTSVCLHVYSTWEEQDQRKTYENSADKCLNTFAVGSSAYFSADKSMATLAVKIQ